MMTAARHSGAYWITGPIAAGVEYRTATGRQSYRIVKVHALIDENYAVVTSQKLAGVYAGHYVGHLIRTA